MSGEVEALRSTVRRHELTIARLLKTVDRVKAQCETLRAQRDDARATAVRAVALAEKLDSGDRTPRYILKQNREK